MPPRYELLQSQEVFFERLSYIVPSHAHFVSRVVVFGVVLRCLAALARAALSRGGAVSTAARNI